MRRTNEMDVARLIKVLSKLPEDSTVYPNTVGDLIVNGEDFEMLGYVSFTEGRFLSVDD